MATRRRSKRLARSVALVGEEAHAAGARSAMTREAGAGRGGGWRGPPLPPQLLHAAANCLEIVSGPGLRHQTLRALLCTRSRNLKMRWRPPGGSSSAVFLDRGLVEFEAETRRGRHLQHAGDRLRHRFPQREEAR